LDHIHIADERDRNYMLPRQAEEPPKIQYKHWGGPKALDQGKHHDLAGGFLIAPGQPDLCRPRGTNAGNLSQPLALLIMSKTALAEC
jgi:hypothetical protein